MMLHLADAPTLSALGIVLAAAGGFIAAIVALLKLKPDANQSAVLQAQGAMETMDMLNEKLEEALARANQRADHYRDRLIELQRQYDRAVAHWGPFPDEDPPTTRSPP